MLLHEETGKTAQKIERSLEFILTHPIHLYQEGAEDTIERLFRRRVVTSSCGDTLHLYMHGRTHGCPDITLKNATVRISADFHGLNNTLLTLPDLRFP